MAKTYSRPLGAKKTDKSVYFEANIESEALRCRLVINGKKISLESFEPEKHLDKSFAGQTEAVSEEVIFEMKGGDYRNVCFFNCNGKAYRFSVLKIRNTVNKAGKRLE